MNTLKNQGLNLIETPEGKVFPKSMKSRDVLDTFLKLIGPIPIKCREGVVSLTKDDVWHVQTQNNLYKSQYVIVATGGMTYPKTGSTGDGYRFAKALKLQVKPMAYGLCPVYIKTLNSRIFKGFPLKQFVWTYIGKRKLKPIVEICC